MARPLSLTPWFHTLSLALLAVMLPTGPAGAEPTQTIVLDSAGPPREVSSVTSFSSADALAGATAFALFSDGSREQAGFTVSGSSIDRLAVAQTAAFVLFARSDSSVDTGQPQEWVVTNTDPSRTLVGFGIDGRGAGAGQAAFDIFLGANGLAEGTPGSSRGSSLVADYSRASFLQGTVTTTYSQPVALAGTAAMGDLFARVDVALAITTANLRGLPAATQFGGAFSSLSFRSDMDTVTYLAVTAPPVPEPASAALLMLGVLGLAGVARRRGPAQTRDIADSLR